MLQNTVIKKLANNTNSSLTYSTLQDLSTIVVCANNIATLNEENHCFYFPLCGNMVIQHIENNTVYWICSNMKNIIEKPTENKTVMI